ncbi:MAG TPA: 50S ribosomal protein L29 [Bryobacteraceae bacterium]|nr:50S ribosomal protein L29 [Bryobacteraceae bacterium]
MRGEDSIMKENADKARALDKAEINKQLHDAKEQMFRLRFQMSMGQMEGVKKVRSLRKERARMLTVLRERELAPAKPESAVVKPESAVVKPKPAAARKG